MQQAQPRKDRAEGIVLINSQAALDSIRRGPYGYVDISYEMGPLTKVNVRLEPDEEQLTDVHINLLKNNATIEFLKLEAQFTGNLCAKFSGVLPSMSRLRSLILSLTSDLQNGADEIANDLCACVGLEELTIVDYSWTESLNITKLLKGLVRLPRVSKLSLEIKSDDEALALGELMRSVKTLKEVSLTVLKGGLSSEASSTFNTNTPMDVTLINLDAAMSSPTLKMLQSVKNLKNLGLHNPFISKDFQLEVAEVLKKCQFIREFEIFYRKNEYPAVDDSIADALQTRTFPLQDLLFYGLTIGPNFNKAQKSLKRVKLERCKFTSLESFFGAMAENRTIETLELLYTAISKQQCIALKEMLSQNSTLTELNLTNQHVATDAAKEICRGVQANKSLLRFHMPGQMLGPSVFESVNTMLQMNDTLEELHIHFIFSIGELEQICAGLKSNKSLTSLQFTQKPEFNCGGALLKLFKENYVLQKVVYKETSSKLQADIEKNLLRNQAISEALKKDMIVLFYNVRRSVVAMQLFPTEIWVQIFKELGIPGYRCYRTAQSILLRNK